jgi:XisH protein
MSILEDEQPDRTLYLAIPLDVYDSFFQLPFTQKIIQQNQIKLIVFDSQKEVIVKWIK